ncbi:hypothetical protein GF324_09955 [bacterium]|nr:hypothetical protein [bacterium]
MDPRARLISTLLILIAVTALPAGGALWGGMLLAAAAPFTIPLKRAAQPDGNSADQAIRYSTPSHMRTVWFRLGMLLLSLSWMIGITVVIQGFVTPGRIVWMVPGLRWTLTEEGLWRGLLFSGRLVAAVLAGGSAAFSITPLDTVKAMDSLLSPLRRLGVATGAVAPAFGLALRYVPTLFDEARQLRNALRARGWNEGRGLRRVSAWIPLVVPLLVGGLRRSDDIAASLYLRGYDTRAKRGALHPLRWTPRDSFTVILSALPLLFALTVWARRTVL